MTTTHPWFDRDTQDHHPWNASPPGNLVASYGVIDSAGWLWVDAGRIK